MWERGRTSHLILFFLRKEFKDKAKLTLRREENENLRVKTHK